MREGTFFPPELLQSPHVAGGDGHGMLASVARLAKGDSSVPTSSQLASTLFAPKQLFLKLHFDILGHHDDRVKNSPSKERSEKMDLQQVRVRLPPTALLSLWSSVLSPSRGTGKSL